jgi:hypothetical protein
LLHSAAAAGDGLRRLSVAVLDVVRALFGEVGISLQFFIYLINLLYVIFCIHLYLFFFINLY